MFKMRAALFGALVLLVTSGLAASTASAAGPFWHVANTKLAQGQVRQIKLQLKGAAVLKTPSLSAEVECKGSISEGATIENSAVQGQGKGRVTYSSCTVLKPSACTVAEPITTKQLKAYLANPLIVNQTKDLVVYEPTEKNLFVILTFSGTGCGSKLVGERAATGSVAAEIIPSEKEGQEGLVVFPQEAITKVIHEGVERTIGLKVFEFTSTFSGAYGARLATNEPFGVFAS